MTTQHTPEPWRTVTDARGLIDGVQMGYAGGFIIHKHANPEANARRIVACVNACAGLSNAELEDHGTGGLKDWMDEADETLKAVCDALEDVDYTGRCEHGIYVLKKQRDELLAAATVVLHGLQHRIDKANSNCKPVFNGIADLHDAIAKARGQQS